MPIINILVLFPVFGNILGNFSSLSLFFIVLSMLFSFLLILLLFSSVLIVFSFFSVLLEVLLSSELLGLSSFIEFSFIFIDIFCTKSSLVTSSFSFAATISSIFISVLLTLALFLDLNFTSSIS